MDAALPGPRRHEQTRWLHPLLLQFGSSLGASLLLDFTYRWHRHLLASGLAPDVSLQHIFVLPSSDDPCFHPSPLPLLLPRLLP